MQHWSWRGGRQDKQEFKRDAHDFFEAGAVVAGCSGGASAVAGVGSVGDQARLCVVIWVITGEHKTLVCAFWREFWDQTRWLRARRRRRRRALGTLLTVHWERVEQPGSSKHIITVRVLRQVTCHPSTTLSLRVLQ